uniref:mitogen-activated protein kinase kinase kinase n=1 Tax=Rhizophora mucronata TaxID=61149 RepID=A0A2P2JKT8_RHIMU
MPWIQSIPFSSAPSTSSATPFPSPSSSASAFSSPKPLPVDETLSPSKRQSSRSILHGGCGGAALASRVGSGTTETGSGGDVSSARKLTRQRKLRHLTDQDVLGAKSAPVVSADVDMLPRSVSDPSSAPPWSARPLTSVPVPLPLPLPVPENSNPGDGDSRLPSPPMERDRDRADGAEEGIYSSPSISLITRGMVSQDIRKMPDHLETRSSRIVHPESSNVDNAHNKKRFNDPIRSAPNSPFMSPLLSQQRIIAASDSFPYHHNILKGSQGWSAPEMASSDVPGLPPPAYFDLALSNENSPLHSPPSSWNPRSSTRPGSPLCAKLSPESSTARHDSNNNLGVHPLPLPPKEVVHPPSLPVPQVIAKPEPTLKSQWLKGKLIGRGTFGSVYDASNRETGALCAMKEVEIFPDDPKSAECIKQLEQVYLHTFTF